MPPAPVPGAVRYLTPRSKSWGRPAFTRCPCRTLATEANVSVGLIYKYFGGKEDLLLATILRIQDAFRDQLSPVIEAASGDPVEQLVAGIRRYIQIVDENLDAVVLTYRGRCIYCGRIEFARRRILRRSTEARPHRGNRSRRANAAPR